MGNASEKSLSGTILVVEDEPQVRAAVCRLLRRTRLSILEADSCAAARDVISRQSVDIILTDVHLQDGSGLELANDPELSAKRCGLIAMTGDERISTAVGALRSQVDDYLMKPFSYECLTSALERCSPPVANCLQHQTGNTEADTLEQWRDKFAPSMLGGDSQMMGVFDRIRKVCDTDCSVLVTGESGTGKELVARALHSASTRAAAPFVTVNCAAIPENLIESELFGHARGAFTGASTAREGRFAAADGGTLFLDEIGELPLPMQAKLLRAVQEKEVTPVGESRARKIDVRIVSATHRDLETMVEKGTFREDLFYRVQVIPIELPALRERKADLVNLIEHFVRTMNEKRNRLVAGVTGEALRAMCAYAWPGNIRQLENIIERMVLLRTQGKIDLEDLPAKIRAAAGEQATDASTSHLPDDGIDLRDAVERFENQLILQALERTGWNKNRAAAVLRMNRTTLVEKLKKKNLAESNTQKCA